MLKTLSIRRDIIFVHMNAFSLPYVTFNERLDGHSEVFDESYAAADPPRRTEPFSSHPSLYEQGNI